MSTELIIPQESVSKKPMKKTKEFKPADLLVPLVLPLLLIGLWEFAGAQGWVNGSILPRPSRMGSTFLELAGQR